MANTETRIQCSVCGFEYNPAEHPSCATCPLHSGCTMACCPNCGVSNINPAGSRLAGLLSKLISGGKRNAQSTLRSNQ